MINPSLPLSSHGVIGLQSPGQILEADGDRVLIRDVDTRVLREYLVIHLASKRGPVDLVSMVTAPRSNTKLHR